MKRRQSQNLLVLAILAVAGFWGAAMMRDTGNVHHSTAKKAQR